MDRGAWRAVVHGVSKSQTWLSERGTLAPSRRERLAGWGGGELIFWGGCQQAHVMEEGREAGSVLIPAASWTCSSSPSLSISMTELTGPGREKSSGGQNLCLHVPGLARWQLTGWLKTSRVGHMGFQSFSALIQGTPCPSLILGTQTTPRRLSPALWHPRMQSPDWNNRNQSPFLRGVSTCPFGRVMEEAL